MATDQEAMQLPVIKKIANVVYRAERGTAFPLLFIMSLPAVRFWVSLNFQQIYGK